MDVRLCPHCHKEISDRLEIPTQQEISKWWRDYDAKFQKNIPGVNVAEIVPGIDSQTASDASESTKIKNA